MYEISIEHIFSAAHAIQLQDGTLEPIHGHDWHVRVNVARDQLDNIETVMDFHQLESLLNALMGKVHNRHLNNIAPFANADGELAINPTAERVAWWIGSEIAKSLPTQVRMLGVSVGEAPGCTATWRPNA